MPTIFVLSKNEKNIAIFHLKIIIFTAVKYYRVIALILVDIVPSWDIEGREAILTNIGAITYLLYSYKYLPLM